LVSGKTAKLSVKNKPKKANYTWKSSNPRIATINKTGKVTAKAKGTATIKIKVKTAKKTYNLSCKVAVKSISDNSDDSDDVKQTYTVTFDSNGGSSVASQTVEKNARVTQPTNPTRNSYTFDGWFTAASGGQKFDFNTAITSNITLYAHWTAIPSQEPTPTPVTYTVTFDSNDGSSVASQAVEKNSLATRPTDPARSGYTFDGWFTAASGGQKFDFNTVITGDITLYAHWIYNGSGNSSSGNNWGGSSGGSGGSATVYYSVSFYMNDGTSDIYDTKSVVAGNIVEEPIKPMRTGYSFTGWYTDSDSKIQYNFSNTVHTSLNLYAGWQKDIEITYKAPTAGNIDSGVEEYNGQSCNVDYVNNQLVVSLKDNVSQDALQDVLESYDAAVVGRIKTIGIYQIEFNSAKSMTELNKIIKDLTALDCVEDAYLNTVLNFEDMATQYYPNETWDIATEFEKPWDELNPYGNNWGVEAINAPSAWKLLIDKYKNINEIPRIHIGVIDSYIDMTHSDLNVSDVYCYQNGLNIFKKNQTETTASEYAAKAKNWEDYERIIHGTHVMGTIGATINNSGINGVALNPELHAVSVAEASSSVVYTRFGLSTALSNLIEDSNCQVINYSMGYAEYDPSNAINDGEKISKVLKKYLDKNYDFLIIASAGNYSSRDAQYGSMFSAITDSTVKSHIIVVGNACNNDSERTVSLYGNQNFGSRIDVIAPGTDIYSTVSPNENTLSFKEDKEHEFP